MLSQRIQQRIQLHFLQRVQYLCLFIIRLPLLSIIESRFNHNANALQTLKIAHCTRIHCAVPLAAELTKVVGVRSADDNASNSGDASLTGVDEKLEVEWAIEDPGAGFEESGGGLGPELFADSGVGVRASICAISPFSGCSCDGVGPVGMGRGIDSGFEAGADGPIIRPAYLVEHSTKRIGTEVSSHWTINVNGQLAV
jgi:hypothetical protein